MTLASFPPISSLATVWVRAQVIGKDSGNFINPTGDTVTMAIVAPGVDPQTSDFKTASWETDSTVSPAMYIARALVGPSGGVVTLVKGIYTVWVKLLDGSETVVLEVGQLVVY